MKQEALQKIERERYSLISIFNILRLELLSTCFKAWIQFKEDLKKAKNLFQRVSRKILIRNYFQFWKYQFELTQAEQKTIQRDIYTLKK